MSDILYTHWFPYEIKTNIPNFYTIDNDIILEIRYVCFDLIWKLSNGYLSSLLSISIEDLISDRFLQIFQNVKCIY